MTRKGSNLLGREEKDKYEIRIGLTQEEFNISDSEVNGIFEFIHTLPRDICPKDMLEEIIKSENLNIRQKVAFSHTLGVLKAEEHIVDTNNRIIVIDVSEFHS